MIILGSEPDRSILLENIKKQFVGGKQSFVCTLCGKTNSQKSNLLKHVESVHYPTLFVYNCKYCGKTFGAKNNLYVHISNYHRENKANYWYVNPFAGNEADAINTHISKILTENGWKFSCTLCGKENVQKGNVVKHVESVHFPNLFSYQCKFCEKQFSARNSLYAHVSRNHRSWLYIP